MPYRKDLKKLLIIGSGPIIIGQAAEFDFSGSQASRSLREEGYEALIINNNPETRLGKIRTEITEEMFMGDDNSLAARFNITT